MLDTKKRQIAAYATMCSLLLCFATWNVFRELRLVEELASWPRPVTLTNAIFGEVSKLTPSMVVAQGIVALLCFETLGITSLFLLFKKSYLYKVLGLAIFLLGMAILLPMFAWVR